MKLTKKQRETIREIVAKLDDWEKTFRWKETEQGFDYWGDVCKNLVEISKPKVREKCGREVEE